MRLVLATSFALILACGGGRDDREPKRVDEAIPAKPETASAEREAPAPEAEADGSSPAPNQKRKGSTQRLGAGVVVPRSSEGYAPTEATFEGPSKSRKWGAHLDPTSVLSVLDSSVADDLGLLPAKALGQLQLGIGGENRAVDVAVLESLTLGEYHFTGLAVAICDDCPTGAPRVRLGANALRFFELDNSRPGQTTLWLDGAAQEKARVRDLQPFVRLRWLRGKGAPAGAWVEVTNLSPRPMQGLQVRAGRGATGIVSEPLEVIEAGGVERVQLIGAAPGVGVPLLVAGSWGAPTNRVDEAG